MSTYSLIFIFYIFSFIYSFPSCIEGENLCIHCNILTDLCIKCTISDILIPDEKGGCIGAKKCIVGKNYCNECDLEGKLCKTCEENYYTDENGGCTYSAGCEISYNGECLKCKDGFILIGKENEFRFCKSLSIDNYKHCENINTETGLCNYCENGYFLTSEDKKCIKTDNCKESIYGNCITCNNGYYYNKREDKCVLKEYNLAYCKESIDGKECDVCLDEYYPDENGICVKTQFCSESKFLECRKCISGYYLSNNLYCSKTENCDTIDKYSLICLNCKNNYYLNTKNYKCRSNLEDNQYKYCQKVVDGQCVKCEFNYYLSQNYICTKSQICEEAENGKCIICPEKYFLGKDNICINVEKCIYSDSGFCIECEDGYYYNKKNKTCIEMHDQYMNCKYSCKNEDKCCECKEDYYLYENDSLCYDNTKEEIYKKCAYVETSHEKCTTCHYGYYLGIEDNKCSKVENCKIVENENKCLECDTFYCLDAKKQECVNNYLINDLSDYKYISCKRTNEEGTTCEQCIEGYEINKDGYCEDIDYCEEKKDGKCVKCKDILSINDYPFCANEIFGCIESYKDNCLRCDNLEDLYECTQCKEGFTKGDYECFKY